MILIRNSQISTYPPVPSNPEYGGLIIHNTNATAVFTGIRSAACQREYTQ